MACQDSITLLAPTTIVANAQSTAVSVPRLKNRWVGVVSLTTVTGTTPTLDITIQHSSDGTNWVTLLAFAQLTAASANTTAHLFAAAATDYLKPLLPYCRLSYVVGGSASPTFTAVAVKLFVDQ